MELIRKSMTVENGEVSAEILGKGTRKLVSINAISIPRILGLSKELFPDSWRSSLGSLLPDVMAMTEAPLTDCADIDYKSEDGTQKTIRLSEQEAGIHKEALYALKKNFEGIITLGKVAGLTEKEISALFTMVLLDHEEHAHSNGVEIHESMDEMLHDANMHDPENWNKCQSQ
ncbi:unnamed protein product [Phytomonas sp. EM1]|nr:unnamed protein product [Phytomonas sp. EM1]|eukprot:CCW63196.1 unnamed protein product [Phytomonas sp. isolate EM1]